MMTTEHQELRSALLAGETFPDFAVHVGHSVADATFASSDLALSGAERRILMAKHSNPERCELQERSIFTDPFMDSGDNHWNPQIDDLVTAMREHGGLKVAVAETKRSYMNHAQALLHGNLHTGNVMVNRSDTLVINPEFAFFGPIGFDLGTLFANLLISRCAHEVHSTDVAEREAIQGWLGLAMVETWHSFAERFEANWIAHEVSSAQGSYWDFPGGDEAFAEMREFYLADVLVEVARHGGCEVLRHLMGAGSTPELSSIADNAERSGVERTLAKIASGWILGALEVTDIEQLVDAVYVMQE